MRKSIPLVLRHILARGEIMLTTIENHFNLDRIQSVILPSPPVKNGNDGDSFCPVPE